MSKESFHKHFHKPINIVLGIFAIFAILGIYQVLRIHSLSKQVKALSTDLALTQTKLASTTAEFQAGIEQVRTALSLDITQQTQSLKMQVGSVAGTLSNLQKLSKTDPQLLAKYSKVFFLNENYAPARTTEIPAAYRYSPTKAVSIHADVWPRLQSMINDARGSGIDITVSSAYRSFAEQKNLKSEYRVIYGAGTANQFSAEQGYSEHQLGTAVDFTTSRLNGALDGFDNVAAYDWLLANAHRYGFILSYPENNSFYQFEPWHWRYVGVKLAMDLKKDRKYFYDLDQRAIDEYLISVFE